MLKAALRHLIVFYDELQRLQDNKMTTIQQSDNLKSLQELMDKRSEMFFWAMIAAFGWFFATPVTARLDRAIGYIEEFPKERFLTTLRLLWSVVQKGSDSQALQRMNQTHERSQMSTQEYHDEFLMILAVFVCEGISFSNSFSSSPLSPEEKLLWFNFWIDDVAAAMNIFPVPQSIEELEQWLAAFKENHIVEGGDENTHVLGELLFGLLHNQEVLSAPELHAPSWIPQDGELAPIILAVMDEKVLKALGATPMIDSESERVKQGLCSRSAAISFGFS